MNGSKVESSRYFGFDIPSEWVPFYHRERMREIYAEEKQAAVRAEYRPARPADVRLKEMVDDALSRLPVSQYVVVANWMECGRIAEVGRRLGISKQRAAVVFVAALERLREILSA